ncbi:hypothetical protein LY78DRAFT_657932 [Colletotrichum sublineola]|uniref:Uncharacterized protein n=1 Tax=Colletotrichum sublineola TaxID=1173701 RepID=A0A066X8R2_COLSU|nr:hypothetical protein LY78DRAFT_657932 [Colletotrichum sublineola]KDN64054.1 hypothetical protein CSUB01_06424 [Colletotrichum sublineola]
MESSAQSSHADLPRAGHLTDGTSGTRRPTTRVPSIAALDHRMQRLEQALGGLTEEHEALVGDAVDGCRAGMQMADDLLLTSAKRDVKGTFWKLCHPFQYPKKCDMLQRHVGVAQHTYRTVVKRCRDAVRPLAELAERARSLDKDAKQVSGAIDEVNARQEHKQRALDDRVESALRILSGRRQIRDKQLKRERDARVEKKRFEIRQATGENHPKSLFPGISVDKYTMALGYLIEQTTAEIAELARETRRADWDVEEQRAIVETLRIERHDGATPKAERLLVAKLGARMRGFRSKLSKLSAELEGKEEDLRAAYCRCLSIAMKLDALQESSTGDLLSGVQDLARGIAMERKEKKKEEAEKMNYWETCKSPEGSRKSITGCLKLR